MTSVLVFVTCIRSCSLKDYVFIQLLSYKKYKKERESLFFFCDIKNQNLITTISNTEHFNKLTCFIPPPVTPSLWSKQSIKNMRSNLYTLWLRRRRLFCNNGHYLEINYNGTVKGTMNDHSPLGEYSKHLHVMIVVSSLTGQFVK